MPCAQPPEELTSPAQVFFTTFLDFRSRALSLVVNQVDIKALAYSLFELYLLRAGRKELNTKTRPRLRDQLLPSMSHVILYFKNCFAFLKCPGVSGTFADPHRRGPQENPGQNPPLAAQNSPANSPMPVLLDPPHSDHFWIIPISPAGHFLEQP